MERQYLLGNEAIAHACLESGIGFVSGYPGTPSSEVVDVLRAVKDPGYHVEWSVNEKVALENALAGVAAGSIEPEHSLTHTVSQPGTAFSTVEVLPSGHLGASVR